MKSAEKSRHYFRSNQLFQSMAQDESIGQSSRPQFQQTSHRPIGQSFRRLFRPAMTQQSLYTAAGLSSEIHEVRPSNIPPGFGPHLQSVVDPHAAREGPPQVAGAPRKTCLMLLHPQVSVETPTFLTHWNEPPIRQAFRDDYPRLHRDPVPVSRQIPYREFGPSASHPCLTTVRGVARHREADSRLRKGAENAAPNAASEWRAAKKFGASEGIRTLDIHLGKVTLYQTELRSLPAAAEKMRQRRAEGKAPFFSSWVRSPPSRAPG